MVPYPHPLDRWRIAQKLIRAARLRCPSSLGGPPGIDQMTLARRANTSQTTISNLENLARAVYAPSRRVARHELVKVLVRGLRLPGPMVTALLYLYDGVPLTAAERRRWLPADAAAAPLPSTPDALWQILLDQLRDYLREGRAREGGQHARAEVFSAEEDGWLPAARAALGLEREPGYRFIVARFPDPLTYPPHWYDREDVIYANLEAAEAQREWLALLRQRRASYLEHLATYGGRTIISKAGLEQYVSAAETHTRSVERRREHVRHLIHVLETYDSYCVGLAATTPDLTLSMKSTVMAILRSSSSEDLRDDKESSVWGPRRILWTDELSVLQFVLDFERAWNRIAIADRTKDDVLRWLHQLLGERSDRAVTPSAPAGPMLIQ
jgi:hypothetical protein